MEGFSTIIMLLVMLGIFYFMLIRPENKQKKKRAEMQNSLKKGDQIVTIGGIVARVVSVQENTIIVETSDDRVRLEMTKWAVSSNQTQEEKMKAAANNKKKQKKDSATEELEASSEAEKQD